MQATVAADRLNRMQAAATRKENTPLPSRVVSLKIKTRRGCGGRCSRSLASVGNCSARCGVRPTSAQAAGTGLPIAAPAAAGHPVITIIIHPVFSDFKRQFPVRSPHLRHYLTHRRDHAGISRFRNAARAEKSAKDRSCVMPDRDPATTSGNAVSRRAVTIDGARGTSTTVLSRPHTKHPAHPTLPCKNTDGGAPSHMSRSQPR